MIEAVLFDCDGVLVSTVALHRDAFRCAVLDVRPSLVNALADAEVNGLSTREKVRRLMKYGLTPEEGEEVWRRKQELTVSLIWRAISRDDAKAAMLAQARSAGLKVACVSNSIRQTTDLMLRAAGLHEHLDLVLSNEDAPAQKPAPDPYLVAMMRLGKPASACIAVEDAPHGVHSANAAGLYVWPVKGPDEVTSEALFRLLRTIERSG